jgi:metal-responsive CopG/Arc/MetJ family transcriptional regulator
MGSHRTHVVLPEELIKQIDAVVGKRGRSAFLADVAQREIIRLRQMRMLEKLASRPPADLSDHPERENAAEWVRKMRQEGEDRFKRLQQELNRDPE